MLTTDEALYTNDMHDGFDFSTSPGLTLSFCGINKPQLADPEGPDRKKLDVILDICDKEFAKGNMTYMICTDKLKDETRDLKRVEAKQTRNFNPADFVDNVNLKKSVGHLVYKLKKMSLDTPAACGINPTGSMWGHTMKRFGKERVAFCDIKGWDGVATLILTLLVIPWLRKIYRNAGPLAMQRAAWSFIACIQAIRFAMGRGRLNNRGNSSGNWLTTFWNTINNWIFHCIILISTAKKQGIEAKEALRQFRCSLYSDDNISCVWGATWWNTPVLVAGFLEHFNIVATRGDKSLDFGEKDVETYIEDADFLSRGIVKRKGIYYAPLKMESILGQLYYVRVPANCMSMSYVMQQLQINLDNVIRELTEYPSKEAMGVVNALDTFIVQHNLPLHLNASIIRENVGYKISIY
jgi:hypothetical protein